MKSIVTFALLSLACFGAKAAAPTARPNILLVMVDDMGSSDIGRYGGEVRTPTLDGLPATQRELRSDSPSHHLTRHQRAKVSHDHATRQHRPRHFDSRTQRTCKSDSRNETYSKMIIALLAS